MAIASAVREGHVAFRGWRTWYRVTGDLDGAKLPLVVLHGGPGFTFDCLEVLKVLADTGRAIVHYDQLGNGRSTHLRDKGADFWTPRLFLEELENLTCQLGIASAYHVLGLSWGGMLCRDAANGPARSGHRERTGLDGTLDARGQSAARGVAAASSSNAVAPRESGDNGLTGIPNGDARLL